MESATTFLSAPCLTQSLGWAPRGRINSSCAPSFVSVRASVAADNNKSVLKSGGAVRMVPTTGITRPMVEILHDLNKPVTHDKISPDKISIPWHRANEILSIYAPGWCGEVRDVKYSDNGRVTVLYRVTILGSDGQAHREAIGTAALNDDRYKDQEAEAEERAFAKACARFGLGLHLYNEK